jgi:hypothetical protein
MYVCCECGHVFEEPEHWEETHGLDYGPYEHMSGCPHCGGGYAEAHKCNCCDDWIDDTYIKTDDGNRYCFNCYRVMELGDED